jgi:hypothetical protein
MLDYPVNVLLYGVFVAVLFLSAVSYLFSLRRGFRKGYIVFVGKGDSLFEGDLQAKLREVGLNGKAYRQEGDKAKRFIKSFHRGPGNERNTIVIGDEARLESEEAVFYIFRFTGKVESELGVEAVESFFRERAA